MSNVKLISIKNREWSHWYSNLVCNAIVKASGSPWIHSQLLVENTMYESTFPDGFRKKENYVFEQNDLNMIQGFKEDFTERELGAVIAWWEDRIKRGTKYGVLKLFVYMILRKTRKFWDLIHYTPMHNDEIWGDFCSAAVINSVLFAGRVMLPGADPEYATPGELIESKELLL